MFLYRMLQPGLQCRKIQYAGHVPDATPAELANDALEKGSNFDHGTKTYVATGSKIVASASARPSAKMLTEALALVP